MEVRRFNAYSECSPTNIHTTDGLSLRWEDELSPASEEASMGVGVAGYLVR